MDRPGTAAGHVGLCVSDLDAALAWYLRVFDFALLVGPIDLRSDDPQSGPALIDVFGPAFRHARVAQVAMGGGVGLELFEFVEPRTLVQPPPDYLHPGFSHLCLVVHDVPGTARRIETAGGRVRTQAWRERPGAPYLFLHFEDPFGNLLELHSHPYAEVFGGLRRGEPSHADA